MIYNYFGNSNINIEGVKSSGEKQFLIMLHVYIYIYI